jgi:AmmeMemoRadiSam system protein B
MQREPIVAGRFYEGNRDSLLKQIEACFAHPLGVGGKTMPSSGKLKALILPHAGYMFSGPPASFGFARLKNEMPLPARIILLGPKHTHYGPAFSVSSSESWKTPLGSVAVDNVLCQEICQKVKGFNLDSSAHQFEHSLEVQLPFLQYVYGARPFSIVPIAVGCVEFSDLQEKFNGLQEFLATKDLSETIFLVSSDFSHDTPRELAYRLDAEVIDLITSFKAREFYETIIEENRSVCGVMPITALLLLLGETSFKAVKLAYSTSMDVMEHDRGVGYAAITFEERQ